MGKTVDWFVRERSRALARMYLTRWPDLVIRKTDQEEKLDFVVTLRKQEELPDVRKFGIVLKEGVQGATPEDANRVVESTLKEFSDVVAPYPIILLYFTMKDNGGYAAWVAEPQVVDEDIAVLYMPVQTRPAVLSVESLMDMLGRIDHWYDVRLAEIRSRERSGRRIR